MNYWIGVIGSKMSYDRFHTASHWFCLPQSCEAGDKVIMYASKKAAGVHNGIFAIFEITNKDECKDGKCRNYGLMSGNGERPVYVDLRELVRLTKNISFQSLKMNPALKNSSFIRRNFQATYFNIVAHEYEAIRSSATLANESRLF
jgi:predicted RNA-binding protein with PUA-like domain